MALTTARAGLTPQQWDDQAFYEYVRDNRFASYMGTGINSIFQAKEELGKKKGDSITFARVGRAKGSGRTGNQTLEGFEEELDTRSMKVSVDVLRHAIAVTDWDEQKSAIELRDAAKEVLQTWETERMRDDIIAALMSVNGVAYGSADSTTRNAWLTANADRVLFGASKSNAVSNVHATALATVDNTSDKLTTASLSLMKRIAQRADPHIRPIKTKGDREYFVVFANTLAFRDLEGDSAMQQANRDARAREGSAMDDNPLFAGGALVWNGLVIREIPEIPILSGVGNGGIDVGQVFLCGAQAVGLAWAQRMKTTTNVRDYGFLHGVGLQEIRGIQKLMFGTDPVADTTTLKDHGVCTGFFAAVADS